MNLAGNVALVTGSGRRMGRAIALAFAEAGADVVINAVSNRDEMEKTAELARGFGVRSISGLGDVRDREAMGQLVDRAQRELGAISVLVNCPAPRTEAPFDQISTQVWSDMLSIVLDGAFVCSQAVLPGMLERGQGTILNLIGIAGQTGRPHRAHIVTAKHGLVGLTKALAVEYAGQGITVNAVSPAFIARGEARAAAPGGSEGIERPSIPVGRQGTQAEVASLCCYLASNDARFITGQVYAINGGVYM